MRTRGGGQGARPVPGLWGSPETLPPGPAVPSRTRRAPRSSPAPKVSLMHLGSESRSPDSVTWRRPPLLEAK